MPAILHELTIDAPPERVYEAITEQAGLAAWWTNFASAQAKVGTISEFSFYGGQVLMRMEITALEPPRRVDWKALAGAPDWPGTRITWELSPADNGTKILFGHRDYASTGGSFASVNYNWAWYLTSLKAYLETGQGNPHTGAPGT